MVGIIGNRLSRSALITGFGMRRCGVRKHCGRGVARRAVGSILGALGHALINRISGAVSGAGRRRVYRRKRINAGSFRLTGAGTYRRRRPVRRIYRKRRTVGVYRRKTTYVRRAPRRTTTYVRSRRPVRRIRRCRVY